MATRIVHLMPRYMKAARHAGSHMASEVASSPPTLVTKMAMCAASICAARGVSGRGRAMVAAAAGLHELLVLSREAARLALVDHLRHSRADMATCSTCGWLPKGLRSPG